MARRLVLFCFMLFVGSVALAQQSVEWRPSVAEDNKAATWEDTSTFMVSILTTRGHHQIRMPELLLFEKDFMVSSRCSMSELRFLYKTAPHTAHVGVGSIDFSKVDPLTVKVSYQSLFKLWMVSLSGTNEGPVASWKGVIRDHVSAADNEQGVIPKLIGLTCGPDEKHCKSDDGGYAISNDEYFDDQEMAKRFARSALHAALLCGVTKAVSPF